MVSSNTDCRTVCFNNPRICLSSMVFRNLLRCRYSICLRFTWNSIRSSDLFRCAFYRLPLRRLYSHSLRCSFVHLYHKRRHFTLRNCWNELRFVNSSFYCKDRSIFSTYFLKNKLEFFSKFYPYCGNRASSSLHICFRDCFAHHFYDIGLPESSASD